MNMDLDTGVMCCEVIGKNVVTLDVGIGPKGNTEYQVTWYNGKRWESVRYRRFRNAVNTFNMIRMMLS